MTDRLPLTLRRSSLPRDRCRSSMTTYADLMKRHMTVYKQERLGVAECGTYEFRGRERAYGHILPKSLQWLNVLEPFRRELRDHLQSQPQIRLQKYFHHLTSSQAFAFNLFFPFIHAGAGSQLLKAMRLPVDAVAWEFEHISDKREETNADVYWHSSADRRTYCEVKLTEQEFGTTTDDARHRRKLAEIYAPILREVVAPELLETTSFFGKYQLLRNIWLAARRPSDHVVFLLPRANETIWSLLDPFVDQLQAAMARRVHVVALEDLLDNLSDTKHLPGPMIGYVTQLREKYLLPAP